MADINPKRMTTERGQRAFEIYRLGGEMPPILQAAFGKALLDALQDLSVAELVELREAVVDLNRQETAAHNAECERCNPGVGAAMKLTQ